MIVSDFIKLILLALDFVKRFLNNNHQHAVSNKICIRYKTMSSLFKLMGGGPTPFFPKTHRNLEKWAKMGKKVYEKRWKQTFYFQNKKIPIFSHEAPKFGFGDGEKCKKMGKKVYGKRGKSIRFNKFQFSFVQFKFVCIFVALAYF